MQDEHIFIQDLLKKHNISVSSLAERAGIADSTMYEYTGGRRKTIPIAIWRGLFELTEDVRILDLLIGNTEIFIVPMPKPVSDDCTEDTLIKLIAKRKMDIECEEAILDILADGKIDEEDWKAIEHYRDAHPEALKLAAQIYKTITSKYEDSIIKRKKSV